MSPKSAAERQLFLSLSNCSRQNDAKMMEPKAVYIVAKERRIDIKYGQEGRKSLEPFEKLKALSLRICGTYECREGGLGIGTLWALRIEEAQLRAGVALY